MFSILGPRNRGNCDGSTRRDFLKVGALGLGGLTLPDLLRARAADRAAGKTAATLRSSGCGWAAAPRTSKPSTRR